MNFFTDPRAKMLYPIDAEGREICLADGDGNVLATAICYGAWWGVCSHRSGIPIDKRATSEHEAMMLLIATDWRHGVSDRDEFASFTPGAKAGVLYIRSLLDGQLLEAAQDDTSAAFQRIADFMEMHTNPSWITARCAETAYERGLLDAQELAWITV